MCKSLEVEAPEDEARRRGSRGGGHLTGHSWQTKLPLDGGVFFMPSFRQAHEGWPSLPQAIREEKKTLSPRQPAVFPVPGLPGNKTRVCIPCFVDFPALCIYYSLGLGFHSLFIHSGTHHRDLSAGS